MTGPDHLVVYGTLRPGAANEHVLAGVAGTWRCGRIRGTRFDDGWHGYPGVVLDHGGWVEVDVLVATDLGPELQRLDDFEGPGYRRVVTPVVLDDGTTFEAWVYELAGPPTGPS